MVPTQVFAMATEQGAPGVHATGQAPEIKVAPGRKVAAIYMNVDGITGDVTTSGFDCYVIWWGFEVCG
jgi:hypothetical protein